MSKSIWVGTVDGKVFYCAETRPKEDTFIYLLTHTRGICTVEKMTEEAYAEKYHTPTVES
ncbi:MAG: hypothetical protein V3S69_00020 [Dehalococcoidales bacterium]